MLILTRKPGESLYIGDNIKVTIVEIKGHQIRVGIDAPQELRIYREEIYLQILEENKKAAEADVSASGLESLSAVWKGRGGTKGDEDDDNASKKRPWPTGLQRVGGPKASTTQLSPEVVVRRKKVQRPDE